MFVMSKVFVSRPLMLGKHLIAAKFPKGKCVFSG